MLGVDLTRERTLRVTIKRTIPIDIMLNSISSD